MTPSVQGTEESFSPHDTDGFADCPCICLVLDVWRGRRRERLRSTPPIIVNIQESFSTKATSHDSTSNTVMKFGLLSTGQQTHLTGNVPSTAVDVILNYSLS